MTDEILVDTPSKPKPQKHYVTIPTSALGSIDWSQTRNTPNAIPKNIAGDTALIKWTGDMPDSIAGIADKGETLDHAGALALLVTDEWLQEI